MPLDTRRCIAAVLATGLARFATLLVAGHGLRGAAVDAGVVTLALTGPARVVWRYRRRPQWAQVPTHHRVAVIVIDLITFAWLGPALAKFYVRPTQQAIDSSPADEISPRQIQVEVALETIIAKENLARANGGYRDVKAATRAFLGLYCRDIGRPFMDDWAKELAPVVFALLVFLGGVGSAVHLGLAVVDGASRVFLAILAVATVAQVLAGVAHFNDRTAWHQLWMATNAATILALGIYLSLVDVGFRSGLPDLAGRLAGFAFPLAILLWQWRAATDKQPGRALCRRAAALTATCGFAWLALNVTDRVLEPPRTVEDIVALVWPLCLIMSASLAALSPSAWGVGSGRKALHDRESREAA